MHLGCGLIWVLVEVLVALAALLVDGFLRGEGEQHDGRCRLSRSGEGYDYFRVLCLAFEL